MSDPVTFPVMQNPSNVVAIGFLGGVIQGYIRENENCEQTGDQEYIKDEDLNDAVCLTSNRGVRFTIDGTVKHGTVLPKKGQTVTIGGTIYIVEGCPARSTAKARRFTMTVYKPDATTWTTVSA